MTLERTEYNGLIIRIEPDSDVESPLEADLQPRFAFWHRQYENPAPEFPGPESVYAAIQQGAVAFPVRGYDHGSIALTVTRTASYPFNDQWDSGFAGFLIYPKDLLKEVGDASPEGLLKEAEGLMEEFANYLNGWGCGYIVQSTDGEELESCWGFLDQAYCLEQAKEAADAHTKDGAA